jgi:hypothetical protein
MGSNKGLKNYQFFLLSNFFVFIFRSLHILAPLHWGTKANQKCVNMHTVCYTSKTRPILNSTNFLNCLIFIKG